MCARVLLAGATGAIGTRLMPLLLQARVVVFGTTRAAVHAGALRRRGIEPIVVYVFNAPAVVMHQLTDLALIHDPGRLAEARRVMAQSIAWVYAPGPEPHAEADPLDFGAAGTAAITIRGVVALERAALTAPTLIENSPRTSVQTHIPRERFILLMAERISRTLFCCTSIVNRRPNPRHNRLCWLSQKWAKKQPCRRHLMARETERIPLVEHTPMASEIAAAT
jgi:hypothetical protein